MSQPVFMTPEDESADANPRDCQVFARFGYHVYSSQDGMCVDCAKPNTRRTDNGR